MKTFNHLTDDIPADVCASCAVTNFLGERGGASVIFCEHSWRAYTRPEPNAPWRRCRIADVAALAHIADASGRLRQLLASGEVNKGPLQ